MNLLGILGTIIVLVILYYLLRYLFASDTISSTNDATHAVNVPAGKLSTSSKSNFTYSIWIYIDNWNTRYGSPKTIMKRGDAFSLTLGAQENDLGINLGIAGGSKSSCSVPNIPLQKWVFILVSVYGRSLDVYIDGKLVKTCILENVASSGTGGLTITPGGGFAGSTSGFRFSGDATNPEQAYNLYRKGVSSSSMGNLFNKYKMKLEFIKDNKTMSSLEI